jgi:hypothetical protein
MKFGGNFLEESTLADSRCLYNKVRYFGGFCVSGVGGALCFYVINGAAYKGFVK